MRAREREREREMSAYRIVVGKHEGKRPVKRPKRTPWIVLKWILEKWDGSYGPDSSGSEQTPVAGSYGNSNEP
jgi:hypothetical protein